MRILRSRKTDALLAGKGTMEIPADSHVTVEIDAGELMTGYLSPGWKMEQKPLLKS